MTHLRKYLKENAITQEAFAASIGVGQAFVSKLANGDMLPSRELAIKIEDQTGGIVTIRGWDTKTTSDPVGAQQ